MSSIPHPALSSTCPRCCAQPGEPCRTRNSRLAEWPHQARVALLSRQARPRNPNLVSPDSPAHRELIETFAAAEEMDPSLHQSLELLGLLNRFIETRLRTQRARNDNLVDIHLRRRRSTSQTGETRWVVRNNIAHTLRAVPPATWSEAEATQMLALFRTFIAACDVVAEESPWAQILPFRREA
jgi:hypothetical protein